MWRRYQPKEIFSKPTTMTPAAEPMMSSVRSAVSALTSLGFLQTEANRAVAGLDPALPAEELIKQALARLSGGKI